MRGFALFTNCLHPLRKYARCFNRQGTTYFPNAQGIHYQRASCVISAIKTDGARCSVRYFSILLFCAFHVALFLRTVLVCQDFDCVCNHGRNRQSHQPSIFDYAYQLVHHKGNAHTVADVRCSDGKVEPEANQDQ